jgi:hypothetical protein
MLEQSPLVEEAIEQRRFEVADARPKHQVGAAGNDADRVDLECVHAAYRSQHVFGRGDTGVRGREALRVQEHSTYLDGCHR